MLRADLTKKGVPLRRETPSLKPKLSDGPAGHSRACSIDDGVTENGKSQKPEDPNQLFASELRPNQERKLKRGLWRERSGTDGK